MLDKLKALLGSRPAPAGDHAYTLLPPAPAARIAPWDGLFPKYDTLIGYSSLGHFFLRASTDTETIVLHPYQAAAKSYGGFATVAQFEATVLQEPGFAEYVLRLPHLALLRARLGPLAADEIYIPQPYPFLGGGEEPESYDKGNVWVFMDIVAQMQGLGA